MTRYKGLTLRILGRSRPAIGPGKAELLDRISATGSISAAAREMGMSYRRAWKLVEALNEDFSGPLVQTATGGRLGGGATVTELGLDVLRRYRSMESSASSAVKRDLGGIERLLKRPPGSEEPG